MPLLIVYGHMQQGLGENMNVRKQKPTNLFKKYLYISNFQVSLLNSRCVCVHTHIFIHSSISGCIYVLEVVNCAALTLVVHSSFQIKSFHLFQIYAYALQLISFP